MAAKREALSRGPGRPETKSRARDYDRALFAKTCTGRKEKLAGAQAGKDPWASQNRKNCTQAAGRPRAEARAIVEAIKRPSKDPARSRRAATASTAGQSARSRSIVSRNAATGSAAPRRTQRRPLPWTDAHAAPGT